MARETTFRIIAGTVADARAERTLAAVSIEDGRIVEIQRWSSGMTPNSTDVDMSACTLVPGFIDIHVHGGAGRNVMEGSEDALTAVGEHLLSHGVTSWLATTVTGPLDETREVLSAARSIMRHGREGANLLGVHLEGPYINPVRKGAQPEQFILPPDPQAFLGWVGDLLPLVRIVTFAPEVSGGFEFARMLSNLRIIPSIGHTDATYDEVCLAIDAGARHVTHCCNAMRPLGSREPGVVGAVMTHPELTAELIWDNIHVHPAVCKALVQAKSSRGVILISDGIPGAGMPEGYQFSLGDLPAVVKSGAARLPDGTLAGSLLTLDRAFANSASMHLPACCSMTSHNAACALGLGDRKGLVAPGYDADLTALDANGNVAAVWVAGQRRL